MKSFFQLAFVLICFYSHAQTPEYELRNYKDKKISFSTPRDWVIDKTYRDSIFGDLYVKKDLSTGARLLNFTFSCEEKKEGLSEAAWISNTSSNIRKPGAYKGFKILDSAEVNTYSMKGPAFWEYSFAYLEGDSENVAVHYIFFRGDNIALLQYVLRRSDIPRFKEQIAKSRDSFKWAPNIINNIEIGVTFELPYNFNGSYDPAKKCILLHPHDTLKAAQSQAFLEIRRELLEDYDTISNFGGSIEAGFEKDNRYSIEERKSNAYFNAEIKAEKMIVSAYIDDVFHQYDLYYFVHGRFIYFYQKHSLTAKKADFYKEFRDLRTSMKFEE